MKVVLYCTGCSGPFGKFLTKLVLNLVQLIIDFLLCRNCFLQAFFALLYCIMLKVAYKYKKGIFLYFFLIVGQTMQMATD